MGNPRASVREKQVACWYSGPGVRCFVVESLTDVNRAVNISARGDGRIVAGISFVGNKSVLSFECQYIKTL